MAKGLFAMAMLCGPVIGAALSSPALYLGWISYDIFMVLSLAGRYLLLVGTATILVNRTARPASFQVKLVGLSLVTVLAVLGVGAALTQRTAWLFEDAQLAPEPGSTLLFEPRPTGGYHISPQPRIDPDLLARPEGAIDVALDNRQAKELALPFRFPLGGEEYDRLFVNDDGILTFERPLLLSRAAHRRFVGVPAIAPLHVDLHPGRGGRVWLHVAADSVVVAWTDVPHRFQSEPVTIQAKLYPSGAFLFSYGRVEAALLSAVRGVDQGKPNAEVVAIPARMSDGSTVSVSAETLAATSYTHLNARYVHARMVPLALLILGSAGFILIAFPLVFRESLVRPLESLLEGVQRMEQGQRDVEVPVHARDEVGRVAEGFNKMARELDRYTTSLEAEVEARTSVVKDQNAQLRTQTAQLKALDEAKSRFFANISHEFRTPLTLILGAMEQTTAEEPDQTEHPTARALVSAQSEHLLKLIDELLDLARMEQDRLTASPVSLDMGPHVQTVCAMFAQHAERAGVELEYVPPNQRIGLRADPSHLRKITSNLLSNAIKFTPRGGSVRVTVAPVEESAASSPDGDQDRDENETVRPLHARAALIVRDTGIGIAEEDQPHVFDRFYQVDDSLTRRAEGIGIGLALTKELVELNGGTIAVTSRPGMGATFEVQLPAGPVPELDAGPVGWSEGASKTGYPPELVPVGKPSGAFKDEQETPRPPRSKRPRVLIAEDHAQLRSYLRRLLEDAYEVEEAPNGVAALAAARARKPDAMIIDVMMPVMDGLALVEALRADAQFHDVPLIVLTAKKNEADRAAGLRNGVDAYLFKPFEGSTLRALVDGQVTRAQTLRRTLAYTVRVDLSDVIVEPEEQRWLERLRGLIEARVNDPDLKPELVAEELGMSTRGLYRYSQRLLHRTPAEHIRYLRMVRAQMLLQQGYGQVQEVATAVGYRSRPLFTRHYKQAFGHAPSEEIAKSRDETPTT